ncbi:hypothetical protein SDC9_204520 [bioreactor metagenome]|uniref:Uncharacterized protein n=1 Tax=bioreactor metagenome TaxID=1076179 RepID=A0A645J098_9ZZZZ
MRPSPRFVQRCRFYSCQIKVGLVVKERGGCFPEGICVDAAFVTDSLNGSVDELAAFGNRDEIVDGQQCAIIGVVADIGGAGGDDVVHIVGRPHDLQLFLVPVEGY